jgi:hypothetical protein
MSNGIIKFWHVVGPFWHICTTVIVMLFLAGIYWGKVEAYDGRITILEVSQKTDSLALATMKQQVADMHEWLSESRKK